MNSIVDSKVNTFVNTTEHIKLLEQVKPAGGYRMGEVGGYCQFNILKKPCWAHRMGVWLVLGWKWVNA